MKAEDYTQMVRSLKKSGEAMKEEVTPQDLDTLHMAVGISGESGELLDAIKKAVIYRKPLDRENVIEELGDLEFYMEGLRDVLGISREETLEANKDKLSERFEGLKYSDKGAQERADKL